VPEDKYLISGNLDAGYGRSQVLFRCHAHVPWRGGVAILGRNGAGKTTLMKAIVGELPLLGGSIMLDSRDVDNCRPNSVSDWELDMSRKSIRYSRGSRYGTTGRRCHDKPR